MAKKVVGYSEFNSKSGGLCRVVTVSEPYNERQKQKGAVGLKCEDIFLPSDCTLKVTEKDIGREVNIDYEISSGRAYVIGVAYASVK
ncbi:MAG: hypothetical protein J1E35_03580 [Lachnospiraceae bacterium]|nr:hypothetical protein [Lachnospiraceae bacterium]